MALSRGRKILLCILVFLIMFKCVDVITQREKGEKVNPSVELRQIMLHLKPHDIHATVDYNLVYAAIVDMAMEDRTISLVCVVDGTTSLYISTGGGQVGIGEIDEVGKATIAFLHSSEQVLDKLTAVSEFPYPEDKKHIVYLVTTSGVFSQEFDVEEIGKYPKELQYLHSLYQNVLTKIDEVNKRNNFTLDDIPPDEYHITVPRRQN